jgi:membrane-associated phospholipid phosphatase
MLKADPWCVLPTTQKNTYSSCMRFFALAVSVVFHPIFIPLYSFIAFMQIDHFSTLNLRHLQFTQLSTLFGIIITLTILFPIFNMRIMKRAQIIKDYHISNKKDRMPVLLSSLVYLLVFYFLIRNLENNQPDVILFGYFLSIITGGILLSILLTIITYYWKISLHSAAAGGLAGGLVALPLVMYPIMNPEWVYFINSLAILLAGIVASSRLYLKAHSYTQVIAGMIIGFGVVFLCVKNYWMI